MDRVAVGDAETRRLVRIRSILETGPALGAQKCPVNQESDLWVCKSNQTLQKHACCFSLGRLCFDCLGVLRKALISLL